MIMMIRVVVISQCLSEKVLLYSHSFIHLSFVYIYSKITYVGLLKYFISVYICIDVIC